MAISKVNLAWPSRISLDCASFTKKTYSKTSAKHGTGLFVAEELAPADLVCAEKPAFYARMRSEGFSIGEESSHRKLRDSLIFKTILKASFKPRLGQRLLKLGGGDVVKNEFHEKNFRVVDGHLDIDHGVIESIIDKNAFSRVPDGFNAQVGIPENVPSYSGVWLKLARLNHSCHPNFHFSFLGDLIIVRTIRPIAKDKEHSISYVPLDPNVKVRCKKL
ncbi:hypothetical protein BCR34DRAFT_224755 [Clohesyomyces aquaticus]|uniref:SET domain-containing protein n=1 Tax=Clohesyomyces aquaticus TaxID=1231657 RepID=A0A1Y1ZWP5_9PLEO|nr:hypothetical protein BCR34DRAFT_224755 [Clohesyomyces aquaticus]